MNEDRPSRALDEATCRLICPISASMVGLCLTGISLIRVVISFSRHNTFADDLLAIDAIGFLIATLTSYAALRRRAVARIHWLERIADAAFIASMLLLTFACLYITYAIATD